MTTVTYDPDALERARLARGLTFGEVAQRAKISPDTASSAIRTGRGRVRTFRAIAKVLDVRLDDLVRSAPASIHAGGPTPHTPNVQTTTTRQAGHVPSGGIQDKSEVEPEEVHHRGTEHTEKNGGGS